MRKLLHCIESFDTGPVSNPGPHAILWLTALISFETALALAVTWVTEDAETVAQLVIIIYFGHQITVRVVILNCPRRLKVSADQRKFAHRFNPVL